MVDRTPRDIVAIIELVIYLLLALVAVLVLFRHGFRGRTTWLWVCFPILILAGIRLAGAGLEISRASSGQQVDSNSASRSLILDAVGLSPLIMILIGMLNRAYVTSSRLALNIQDLGRRLNIHANSRLRIDKLLSLGPSLCLPPSSSMYSPSPQPCLQLLAVATSPVTTHRTPRSARPYCGQASSSLLASLSQFSFSLPSPSPRSDTTAPSASSSSPSSQPSPSSWCG